MFFGQKFRRLDCLTLSHHFLIGRLNLHRLLEKVRIGWQGCPNNKPLQIPALEVHLRVAGGQINSDVLSADAKGLTWILCWNIYLDMTCCILAIVELLRSGRQLSIMRSDDSRTLYLRETQKIAVVIFGRYNQIKSWRCMSTRIKTMGANWSLKNLGSAPILEMTPLRKANPAVPVAVALFHQIPHGAWWRRRPCSRGVVLPDIIQTEHEINPVLFGNLQSNHVPHWSVICLRSISIKKTYIQFRKHRILELWKNSDKAKAKKEIQELCALPIDSHIHHQNHIHRTKSPAEASLQTYVDRP